MTPNTSPFIIYAESTPNPSTMKFVANKYLMQDAVTFESDDPNGNAMSPLSARLFNFSFVKKVFLANNYVSITRTDTIEWEDVVHQVREFISDYLNKGGEIYLSGDETVRLEEKEDSFTSVAHHRDPKTMVEKNIIAILDEYIKPAVENDGGAILFDSFEGGKVNLILKGACSGCPSSTMTLKSGIETLLKQMMPEDVREVNAVNG